MIKPGLGQKKVGLVMHEFGKGTLHSGSKHGPVVTDQKQAVAIAMSQARKVSDSFRRKFGRMKARPHSNY